jgi:hypothetical protein
MANTLFRLLQCSQGGFCMASEEPGRARGEAGSGGGLEAVTPMREFADQKALQDYVKAHDLVYLWEGTRPFRVRNLRVGADGQREGQRRENSEFLHDLLKMKVLNLCVDCGSLTTPPRSFFCGLR